MDHLTTLIVPDARDHETVLSAILDERVFITELLNGSHWEATITRGFQRDQETPVENTIQTTDPELLMQERLDYALDQLIAMSPSEVESITFRGTIIGRDDAGWYSAAYGTFMPEIRLHYAEINGITLAPVETFRLFAAFGLKTVPVLDNGGRTLAQWLDRRPYPVASVGYSRLAYVQRRGVVVRPLVEMTHPDIGSVILKLTPNPEPEDAQE